MSDTRSIARVGPSGDKFGKADAGDVVNFDLRTTPIATCDLHKITVIPVRPLGSPLGGKAGTHDNAPQDRLGN